MKGETLEWGRRWALAVEVVLLGALVLLGGACTNFPGQTGESPKAKLLEKDELPLVMSRLGRKPERVVTAAERVRVRAYFDPQLVDLSRVTGYSLWSLDPKTSNWEKIGSATSLESPLEIQAGEGLTGLRASVDYAGGKESLLPLPGDEPALWLAVDRKPPALTWVEPSPGAPLARGVRVLDLAWVADEIQFGTTPHKLEWSSDQGRNWKPIATVPPVSGQQGYRWRLPDEVVSDILVRLEAQDLVGHKAAAVLPLAYAGAVSPSGRTETFSGRTETFSGRTEPGAVGLTPGVVQEGSSALAGAVAVGEAGAGREAGAVKSSPAAVEAASAGAVEKGSALEPQAQAVNLKAGEADRKIPELVNGEVPRVVGAAGLVLAVAIKDKSGAGLEEVEAYLRQAGGSEWKLLPAEKTCLAGNQLTLDVSHLEEAAYELFLRAVDRAGNGGPGPETSSQPLGHFQLDLSPPELALRAAPVAWVAGFRAEVQLDVDWSDAVPPLLVEGEGPDGRWSEIERWKRPAPGQNLFSFPIPFGVEKYSVRFTLVDAAGNRGQLVVGPRELEPPIRFVTFTQSREYPARGTEPVRWELSPVAAEKEVELRVNVFHQRKPGGEWTLIFENVPASSVCYWDMPPPESRPHPGSPPKEAGDEQRLRLSLSRGGKLVAEVVSEAFTMALPSAVPPTVVSISQESLFYSDQARDQSERYRNALAASDAGVDNARELEGLSRDVVAAYRKARELDPKNYQAIYALAQFLNRQDAKANAREVLELLLETVKIKPDHSWALNDLGALYIRDATFDKAEEVLAQAALIKPLPIVLYNLGLAHFYRGNMTEARRRFEAALQSEEAEEVPQGEIYYYLVHSYLQEGELERARSLLREKEALIPSELLKDLMARL